MTDEIKRRIEQMKNGKVPEGYKLTLLGIRPLDWQLKKIGAAIKSTPRPIKMNDNDKYQLITVRRAYGGVVSRGIYQGKEILVKSQFRITLGDFIISKRQIVHGACGVVRQDCDNAIVSNEYNVFTINPGHNLEYFNFSMQLPKAKHLFYIMSIGVHIEKMLFGTAEWLRQKIAFPSTGEQERIAEILTHCDKVIELKKQLIAEEGKQKEWLMQNLLNPDSGVRLEGFDAEWKETLVGDISKSYSGGTPKSSQKEYYALDGITFIRSGEINKDSTELFITQCGYDDSSAKMVKKGDLLYALYGANSGECAISKIDGAINQAILCIRSDTLLTIYLFYVLLDLKETIVSTYLQGGQGNLSADIIKKLAIRIPSTIEEQTAIANILSTADRKIELLEQELAQWQQKKKALKQLLLTGIVRVNV